MATGQINVTADNIFPIIKKFLYSDHEIFLRELVSNAVDANTKLKKLTAMGEHTGDLGDLRVEVKIDKEAKTLTISDNGLGMTSEEVEKYINQIAFSGAEEFVKKYEEKDDVTGIIGHFGLGFYSAFMVSERVEIFTKSFKDAPAVRWECDGSPAFSLEETEKETRGTDIVLHIADDSTEFLEDGRIGTLLNKYCKFLPIEIKFGTKEETKTEGEGDDKKETKLTVDNIINNPNPAWTKSPTDLKDEDYNKFYRELYPMNFEDPMFHIHLNVDYPFNLTGVLYFPKLSKQMDIQKDKVQLYSNQVYVTDNLEGVVPEFLTFLKGVIDSPDIPLNVSRSYLQSDGNVKKISNHITKKVADKLAELFKADRTAFEEKWEDIKVIIEYGMLSDEKFYEKAQKFALFPTTDGKFHTFDELKELAKENQTDKDGNLVMLYTNDAESQYSKIQAATAKGYQVVVLNSPICSHLIGKLEQQNEKMTFSRIDADALGNLIKKTEEMPSLLTDADKDKIKPIIEAILPSKSYTVQFENLSEDDKPFMVTQSEFMRRMKEMNSSGGGGGMMAFGELPDSYSVVANTNNKLFTELLNADEAKQKEIFSRGLDLALLENGLLKGEKLDAFINASYESIQA
jgi:molecular chaperone HtpG